MMSLSQIRDMSARQARKASRLHKKPYLFEEEDRTTFPPFPFPNIGDYRPKGWELIDNFMVDKTGFGASDEPALTTEQLIRRLKAGYGYAIIEEGQFQIVLGEFISEVQKKTLKFWMNIENDEFDAIKELLTDQEATK